MMMRLSSPSPWWLVVLSLWRREEVDDDKEKEEEQGDIIHMHHYLKRKRQKTSSSTISVLSSSSSSSFLHLFFSLLLLITSTSVAGVSHRGDNRGVDPYHYDHQLSLSGTSMTLNGNGYDTAMGNQPLCWTGRTARYEGENVSSLTGGGEEEQQQSVIKHIISSTSSTLLDDFYSLGRTKLIQDCSSQTLRVEPPKEVHQGKILRTGQLYNFTVQAKIDLSALLMDPASTGPEREQIWWKSPSNSNDHNGEHHVIGQVKLILCDVHTSGFCTPYVHQKESVSSMTMEQAGASPQPTATTTATTTSKHAEEEEEEKGAAEGAAPYDYYGNLHGKTHLDSYPVPIKIATSTTQQQKPSLQVTITNQTIPMMVNVPGEYFVIATLELYTQEIQQVTGRPIPLYHRWDIANAILLVDGQHYLYPSAGGRVLNYHEPPILLKVSSTVEIISYIAIVICSCIVMSLLMTTIYYRKSEIIQLTQGSFLIAYLICALIVIMSTFLLNPKSDAHCLLSGPILFLSIQLMFAITAGRLWRIYALLSPILKHRDCEKNNNNNNNKLRSSTASLPTKIRGSVNKQRHKQHDLEVELGGGQAEEPSHGVGVGAGGEEENDINNSPEEGKDKKKNRCMNRLHIYFQRMEQSCFRCFPFLRKYRTATECSKASEGGKKGGLRRTIPYWHLNLAIFVCTLPQLLLQIAALTKQPQHMVISWNEDESIGRVHCDYVPTSGGGGEDETSLVFISFVALVVFLLILLAMAFYCRNKLPSVGVLNETRQIYDTTLNGLILLVLAAGLLQLTSNDGDVDEVTITSPNVEYAIWVSVILWMTVNSAVRLMYGKLRMAWKGETVMVSALVREHHQKQREKQEAWLKELTDKANSFQKCVLPLVKDHSIHSEVLKACFVGEEAIDALVNAGVVSSRWEGTQLGRELVSDLKFFTPVGGSIQAGAYFQDDWVLYRFRDFFDATGNGTSKQLPDFQNMQQFHNSMSLTASVRTSTEHEIVESVNRHTREDLETLAEGFKSYVDVRDRKYHLRTFHNCFVGSEAVDSMLYAGLATSREEAVRLGKRLEKDLQLFHHVCDDWNFEDKRLFYRFRPRRGAGKMKTSDMKASISTAGETDELETDEYWPDFGRRGRGHASSSQMTAMTSPMSSSICTDSSLAWNMSVTGTTRSKRDLTKAGQKFVDVVGVRDRRYHMRTYKRVFVGAEAVDSIVYSGMAATRWDAVQLGRALVRELALFEHVTREHNFNDDFLFYRYTNINVPKALVWDETTTRSCDFRYVENVTNNNTVCFTYAKTAVVPSESSDGMMERSQLAETAEAFKSSIDARDRKYRGIKHKNCFWGNEACDSLVFAGIAKSRPEAVRIGRYLARELRLFKCVTGSHVFADEPLLYSFRRGVDTASSSGNSSGSDSNGTPSLDESSNSRRSELVVHAEAFKKCAVCSDRRYRLRIYKNCFVGCDTVDNMLEAGLAETRHDCVQLARQLARELKLFRHVCGDHDFTDAYLFFEFTGPLAAANGDKEEEVPNYKLERLADCDYGGMNNGGRLTPVQEVSSRMTWSQDGSRPLSVPAVSCGAESDVDLSITEEQGAQSGAESDVDLSIAEEEQGAQSDDDEESIQMPDLKSFGYPTG